MEFNGMGWNWQAHNNSHHPPVPRENPSELQQWSKWSKAPIPVTSEQLQATFSSQLSNEKHSVMGGRWLSQHCHVSLTVTGCFGKPLEALPLDCSWAVTGTKKTGCGLGFQPNTIFQKPHSHPATQPCGELWTLLPSLENNNPLPSEPADSSARLPGQGTQQRQPRGTAPYAHLAQQLQLCFQLHCYKSVAVMYSWKLARFFQL